MATSEEHLEQAREQLEQAASAVLASDGWQRWLDTAAKFHNYSVNNQFLIMVQNPDATQVAGFNRWKDMGRSVNRGESAMWILAPVTVRVARDGDGSRVLTRGESAAPGEEVVSRIVNVKPVPVFDVAQTSGEPLPERPRPALLDGQAPAGVWDGLSSLAESNGFAVERGPCPGQANGITYFDDRRIRVRDDVDDAQAVKTLAHEVGHMLLHDPDDDPAAWREHRGSKEVEAESVAYLVAREAGLDTSDYSFVYVAGWAQQAARAQGVTPEQVMRDSATRVVSAASTVLEALPPLQEDPVAVGVATQAVALTREAVSREAQLAVGDDGTYAIRGGTVVRAGDDGTLVLDVDQIAEAAYEHAGSRAGDLLVDALSSPPAPDRAEPLRAAATGLQRTRDAQATLFDYQVVERAPRSARIDDVELAPAVSYQGRGVA